MGFDVMIIAKVMFHDGKPYTSYRYKEDHWEYFFDVPDIPEHLKGYTNLRGSFWSQFFEEENWVDVTYFLVKYFPLKWEDVEEKDDDYKEDYEKLKELLEWCRDQSCDFTIGWY